MFEYHNNILCVQGGFLYGEASIMSFSNYKKLSQRKALTVVRRGGNGRSALVDFETMPERFKAKIVEQYGNPHETAKNYKFIDYLKQDQEALEFFREYRLENGSTLPKKKISEYVADASVLNAIKTIVTTTAEKRKALGGKATKIWERMASIIQDLPKATYPHTLPSNPRSLKNKFKLYNSKGYEVLIHKGFANRNSEKINSEAKVWLIARWGDRVVKVANHAQLLFEYNEMAIQKGWKVLKRENTLRDYLNKEGIKHLWYGHRYGDSESKEKYTYHHTTRLPSMRDSLWYSDGTKLNYFYRDENGKVATCQVYEVIDAYSEVFLGYHISPTENYQAQYGAYKMAVQVSGHKPYQIGFDGQGGHKKLKSGNFLTKVSKLAIRTAPYNGKSKTIESAFGRFQAQFLKQDWFFTGQNITATKLESKANREFINANVKSLPTLKEVKAIYLKRRQEWNNAPHPKTGQPRIEMYNSSINPETPQINVWDMIDLFWIERPVPRPITASGISFKEKNIQYEYTVFGNDQLPDVEWMRNNIDKKFIIKFDPEDFSAIHLYEQTSTGLCHVKEARTKIEIHRGKQEQENWENEFIQAVKAKNVASRLKADSEMDDILEAHEALPEQYGLKSPSLLGVKSKRKKAQNNIGKIQKQESNQVPIDIDIYNRM